MITPLPDAVVAARLLPLLDHHDPDRVVEWAQAAEAAGAPAVEVALRHPSSVDALRRSVEALSIPVGAGTVIEGDQARASVDAGAAFLVSPGCVPSVAEAAGASGTPWLPGAATPTEVLRLRYAGASLVKLFPAAALGGPRYVAALTAVVGLRLVPTGGVTAADARDYLAVPGVVAVGGSWMFRTAAGGGDDAAAVVAAVRAALDVTRPA